MNPTLTTAAKKMYAKCTVNIRCNPNVKSKIVGQFNWNDTVKVIKRINKKWLQIKYKNKIRYIYAKYIRKKKCKYKAYDASEFKNTNSFKSFEDGNNITNSTKLAQGKLKKKWKLDKTGVYKVDDRYCIAVGSYYTKKIGIKIDLVLCNPKGEKHILKCITADSKDNKDTTNDHRVHITDGSMVEFVVSTKNLIHKAKQMGDISYAGKQFKGYVKEIRVYSI